MRPPIPRDARRPFPTTTGRCALAGSLLFLVLVVAAFAPAPARAAWEARLVHDAGQPVYALAAGDLDDATPGEEVAALLADGSVVSLAPGPTPWPSTLLGETGQRIFVPGEGATLSLGDLRADSPGLEVVVQVGIVVACLFRDAGAWSLEEIVNLDGFVADLWTARAGDADPDLPGDEVVVVIESPLDFSNGFVHAHDGTGWSERLVYQAEVAMDVAVGELDAAHPGREIVFATEMGPTYLVASPPAPGPEPWPTTLLWDDMDEAGWVVKVADVEPARPGTEIVLGTRYSTSIALLRDDGTGSGALELVVAHVGDAPPTAPNTWDVAVGQALPDTAELEIAGVDDTGAVSLASHAAGAWSGETIWAGDGAGQHAVVMADFLPAVPGDEILVGGRSGALWLLSRVASDRDGDGVEDGADCAPDDGDAWAPPGEARDLRLERDGGAVGLTWSAPDLPGASTLVHDVLRAATPDGFDSAACVATDAPGTSARDDDLPSSPLSSYLVRCENACPDGAGPLGRRSDGGEREGRACP